MPSRLEVKVSNDDSRPDRIHVIGGFLRTFNALGARQQVLFEWCKFGFVHNRAKVVAFKIVVGNVFHANLVCVVGRNSQNLFGRVNKISCPLFSIV